jgi:DNA-binding transcriptional LysR family regulator
MMNTDQLKTFREVVKLGSFSEVAKKLAISQPAVSFQIQKLEQELGMRLIDRTQRVFTLTAAGRRLLRFAETVARERQGLLHDLEQLRDEVSGELVIAASTMPGEFLLPPLLARFKQRHPAVGIQVDVSDSLNVIERVLNHSYEVGFCGLAPPGHDLKAFKIAEDEIVLIVSPEHPFARRSEVAPVDLAGEPLIFREATSGTQRSLEEYLSRAGLDPGKLKPHLVLGSTLAVISAVASGSGIAFVSNLALNTVLSAPVRPVRVKGLHMKRDFYGVFRPERIVSRLLEEFIGFIRLETAHDGGKND